MLNNTHNSFNNTNTVDLPGYFVQRSQLAERRELERKSNGSWLDDIGEVLFVDAERAFVIPGCEMAFVSPERIRATGWSRLVKLVVSEDAGILCTTTGHISSSWLGTFSKMTVPQIHQGERHYVKHFAPTHDGAIVGYHAVRGTDNRLNWRCFEHAAGNPICELDFVSYEGKCYFSATVNAHIGQKQLGQVFVREAALKTIKEFQSVSANWSTAAWCDGYDVANLRCTLQNGQRQYSFLDCEQNAWLQAAPGDKSAKVVRKNVRGVLTAVSGWAWDNKQYDRNQLNAIIADDKIIALGKDEIVLCDLTKPEWSELAGWMRQSRRVSGVLGKNGYAYLTLPYSPLSNVMVTRLNRITQG